MHIIGSFLLNVLTKKTAFVIAGSNVGGRYGFYCIKNTQVFNISGLEFMREHQMKDIRLEPYYMCELCEERVNSDSIVIHISSLKHRILFIVIEIVYQFLNKTLVTLKFFEAFD